MGSVRRPGCGVDGSLYHNSGRYGREPSFRTMSSNLVHGPLSHDELEKWTTFANYQPRQGADGGRPLANVGASDAPTWYQWLSAPSAAHQWTKHNHRAQAHAGARPLDASSVSVVKSLERPAHAPSGADRRKLHQLRPSDSPPPAGTIDAALHRSLPCLEEIVAIRGGLM